MAVCRSIRSARPVRALCLSLSVALPALVTACGGDTWKKAADAAVGTTDGGMPIDDAAPTPFVRDHLAEVAVTLPVADVTAMENDPTVNTVFAAQVTWDGAPLKDVAFSVRGSGSAVAVAQQGSLRYSFKLDLNDNVSGQTLDGEKKLYLNENYKDPTHLREILSYEVLQALGVPAPRAVLAHVTLNGKEMGIYTAVEAVDGGFITDHFADAGGNLYALEDKAGTLKPSDADPPVYPGISVERGSPKGDPPDEYLALVNGLADPATTDLGKYVDVDLTLRYLAAQTALVALDSYSGTGANYSLYAQSGVFTPIAFDLGESFGRHACGCTAAALMDFPVDEPTCDPVADRPLVARLFDDPALLSRYHTHLDAATDALEGLADRVTTLAALIRPNVQTDTEALFPATDFEWSLTKDLPDPRADGHPDIFGLTRFLTDRVASIRAQRAGTLPATRNGAGACPKAPNAP